MAFLELTNVSKAFDRAVAVQGFDLSVARGEFVSFLGPSGCGKTTVLRMIAGFETPSAGTIRVDGRDLTRTPPNRRNIGMVFQSYALFPNMTVADNIAFGLRVAGQPRAETRRRVAEMLALIQLGDLAGRYPYQLSGGQQQRVALGRALARQPHLLLLDEPLSALDAKVRADLRGEIRRIQQQLAITTVFVTHDQEEAMAISDRVIVMSRGRIEQASTPFDIYHHPQTPFVASFVGTLNQVPCTVVDSAQGTIQHEGTVLRAPSPIAAPPGTPVVLMVRPEAVRLGPQGGANQLQATVRAVHFLGPIARIEAQTGAVPLTVDLLNERTLHLPRVGERCLLSFAPDACWVMVVGE